MFTNITWPQYFVFLVILLIFYYLFVGIKYYFYELKSILKSKRNSSLSYASKKIQQEIEDDTKFSNAQGELFVSDKKATYPNQEADYESQQIEDLTSKLKQAIEESVSKKRIKEEFILSIKLVLKKYHFLKGSPFLVAINNLIASECERLGYIQLSAEERVMLWNE